jgi:hypothetical protein
MSDTRAEPVPIPGASASTRHAGGTEPEESYFDKAPDSPWISPSRPGYSRTSSFSSLMGKSFDRYGEDFGGGAATLLGESYSTPASTSSISIHDKRS